MKVPDPSIDRLLRTAIKQKRLIQFVFRDKPRIVEPHDYGIYKGRIKISGYQVGGLSSEPIPNWRWAVVNEISDLRLLKQTLPGRRPTLSGKHQQWDQIFIGVEPPPETEASATDQRCGMGSAVPWSQTGESVRAQRCGSRSSSFVTG